MFGRETKKKKCVQNIVLGGSVYGVEYIETTFNVYALVLLCMVSPCSYV